MLQLRQHCFADAVRTLVLFDSDEFRGVRRGFNHRDRFADALGHACASTTEIYAARDEALASRVMAEIG